VQVSTAQFRFIDSPPRIPDNTGPTLESSVLSVHAALRKLDSSSSEGRATWWLPAERSRLALRSVHQVPALPDVPAAGVFRAA
jgi:hypothetical protein